MAKEIKPLNQDRDNSIAGELLQRKDNEKKLDQVLALTKPIIDTSDRPAAQSQWSTGRGCPKCKHTLRMKEMTKNETLIVFCGNCGSEYHHDDLENTSAIGDAIHRQIPDDVVLRYMAARARQLRIEG